MYQILKPTGFNPSTNHNYISKSINWSLQGRDINLQYSQQKHDSFFSFSFFFFFCLFCFILQCTRLRPFQITIILFSKQKPIRNGCTAYKGAHWNFQWVESFLIYGKSIRLLETLNLQNTLTIFAYTSILLQNDFAK